MGDLDDWDANQALNNLHMEKALSEMGNPSEVARRLFEENLPLATMAICHLATRSESEAIRFNAAKYVVERTMGPAQQQEKVEGRHIWEDIYEDVIEDLADKAEGFANGGNP
jgi:hypothetical protein